MSNDIDFEQFMKNLKRENELSLRKEVRKNIKCCDECDYQEYLMEAALEYYEDKM